MRTLLTVLVLLTLATADASRLQAQIAPPGRSPLGTHTLMPFHGLELSSAGNGSAGWQDRLLTAVAGAALGAGMGFFMSQVDRSDWEEIPGRREASRGLWSALGGGVGLAMGLSFPVSLTGQTPQPFQGREAGRSVIPPSAIQDVSADNAYQIVRLLRPEWLNERPPSHLGRVEPEGLEVFLDDFWYGELDSLRGIHIQTIESIRFVPGPVATARWGPGYPRGVIQVITVG